MQKVKFNPYKDVLKPLQRQLQKPKHAVSQTTTKKSSYVDLGNGYFEAKRSVPVYTETYTEM